MRLFARLVLCLACLAALFCLVCAVALSIAGRQERLFSADVAVVFSNTAYPNNTPSPSLTANLDRALALHRDGFCRVIIVSGSRTEKGVNEALIMRDYLLARGVPAGALVTASSDADTVSAARFTAAWLAAHGGKSAIAVSQYFHLPRARLTLSRTGINRVGTARGDYWEWRDLYFVPREVATFWTYFFR